MIKIYGSMLCEHCRRCREDLDGAGVEYEFLDFADSLANLKAFLAYRDTDPAYDSVRENGKIGIPTIIREDGTLTRSWEEFL